MTANLSRVIFLLCLMAQTAVYAQEQRDTTIRVTKKRAASDSIVVKDSVRLALEARPRIAATRSAIVPGLGQLYNKRWWKVPLVYGGLVGIGLVIEFNQTRYKIFLKEAQFRELNPGKTQNPLYAGYSNPGIIAIKDAYRRNRDLSILSGLGFYAVQIIDAYVDAKFFRFDVSDELSLKVTPSLQNGNIYYGNANVPVVGLQLNLRIN